MAMMGVFGPLDMASPRSMRSSLDDVIDSLECLNSQTMAALRARPQGELDIIMSCNWVESGLPVLRLSHARFAAALAATRVPPDVEVHAPWKSFVIELPTGIEAIHIDGKPIEWIRVQKTHWTINNLTWMPEERWCYWAETSKTTKGYWAQGLTLFESEVPEDTRPFALDINDEDKRVQALIHRIILGSCLYVASQKSPPRPKIDRAHVAKSPQKDSLIQTFVYGEPCTIDARPALSDYVSGRRSREVSVRHIVRGHWREQACGPHHTERRPTWIKPHWSGAQGGPTLVKPYVVDAQ